MKLIHASRMLIQCLDDRSVIRLLREVCRGVAVRVTRRGVGARFQQPAHDGEVIVVAGIHQRRGALFVQHVHARAALQQPAHDGEVIVVAGIHQRRAALFVHHVHARAALQQPAHDGEVTVVAGIHQRRAVLVVQHVHARASLQQRRHHRLIALEAGLHQHGHAVLLPLRVHAIKTQRHLVGGCCGELLPVIYNDFKIQNKLSVNIFIFQNHYISQTDSLVFFKKIC